MLTPDLRGHTVLVLHAHPDDESIFTGVTLRRLADAGARTVLVVATAGELGMSRVPLRIGETVPERRIAELERAAELLGVARLALLGCRDSGLPGWDSGSHVRALAVADPLRLAASVARIAAAEGATTIVHDDEQGIYGHPDHRATSRVGATAAELLGVSAYRMTVDREHLHISARDRHLVHGAARAAAVPFGRMTGDPARDRRNGRGAGDQAGGHHRAREPGRRGRRARRRLRRRLRPRVVPPLGPARRARRPGQRPHLRRRPPLTPGRPTRLRPAAQAAPGGRWSAARHRGDRGPVGLAVPGAAAVHLPGAAARAPCGCGSAPQARLR